MGQLQLQVWFFCLFSLSLPTTWNKMLQLLLLQIEYFLFQLDNQIFMSTKF